MIKITWLDELLAKAGDVALSSLDAPSLDVEVGERALGQMTPRAAALYSAVDQLHHAHSALIYGQRDEPCDQILVSEVSPADRLKIEQLERRYNIVLTLMWDTIRDDLKLTQDTVIGLR